MRLSSVTAATLTSLAQTACDYWCQATLPSEVLSFRPIYGKEKAIARFECEEVIL